MQPFHYDRPATLEEAVSAAWNEGSMILAGGTTMVDLMRCGVLAPRRVVDISGLGQLQELRTEGAVLRFGALVPMADAAEDAALRRDYPALAQSLQKAASQQLRNVATLGGNLLQRTRCVYFRDGFSPCNKRMPGTGCSALDGHNREHALLGGSDRCVAVYPGDWGAALAAFDAVLELVSAEGRRTVPLADFFARSDGAPDIETVLRRGEIITAICVPATQAGRLSAYCKVRDRQSYAFAVASAVAALRLEDGLVVEARIALGGVATRPWRSPAAEQELVGQVLSPAIAARAGEAAFATARTLSGNTVKRQLGPRVVAEAIRLASRQEWA